MKKLFLIFVGALLAAALAFFGLSWCVMLLWNAVIPAVLSLPTISYWQATGLMVLCNILFKPSIDSITNKIANKSK